MKQFLTLILCLIATSAFAQEVRVASDEAATVGRLHEVTIVATVADGETPVPADSLLVDVDGNVDYELYENSSKVAYVPTGDGRIKFRIVAVWFDLKIAKQEVITIQAARGPPTDDPEDPPADQSKLESLTGDVQLMADRMQDPFTRKSLANVYAAAAKAIQNEQSLKVTYFNREYTYDLTGDLDSVKSKVSDAISRTMSYAKSQNKTSDSKNWADDFLKPTKSIVSRDFPNMRHKDYAAVLAAIGEGLK